MCQGLDLRFTGLGGLKYLGAAWTVVCCAGVVIVSVRALRVDMDDNRSQLRKCVKERVSHFFGQPVTLSCWQILPDEKI